MDWFLYDNGLRHEKVKEAITFVVKIFVLCVFDESTYLNNL